MAIYNLQLLLTQSAADRQPYAERCFSCSPPALRIVIGTEFINVIVHGTCNMALLHMAPATACNCGGVSPFCSWPASAYSKF